MDGCMHRWMGSLWLQASATWQESFWLRASMLGEAGRAAYAVYPVKCLITDEMDGKPQSAYPASVPASYREPHQRSIRPVVKHFPLWPSYASQS